MNVGVDSRATLSQHKNRTDLGKGAHQCDETQRNSSTQVLLTRIVLFGCKKIEIGGQQKEETKKRTDNELIIINTN